jgi:hypothetical protein
MIGGVQGYVTNTSGVPIIGAVIYCISISNPPPTTNQQTTSAPPDGYYSFVFDTPITIQLLCGTVSKIIAFRNGQAKLANFKIPG